MWLQNLRGLIDNGKVKRLESEDRYAARQGGSRAYQHTCPFHQFAHLGQARILLQSIIEKEGTIFRCTAETITYSKKVDALLDQLAADFIDSAVGERQDEHVAVRLQQLLLQCVEHTIRSLSRARRADDKEKVCCLFDSKSQFVETTIIPLEAQFLVDAWHTLHHQQVASLLGCCEESMHATILGAIGGLHEVMLNGPIVFFSPIADKDMLVALGCTKLKGDTVCCNVRYAGAENHCPTSVRFFLTTIGICDDNVTDSEIRHIAGSVLSKTEFQAHDRTFMLAIGAQQRELVVDVA